MPYKILLFLHLASVIVWLGGMVFALFCLRPVAVALLPPPQRVPLMQQALGRFFVLVGAAVLVILGSGVTMMLSVGMKSAPITWHIMLGLGVLMMAIFGHIRFVPYARLRRFAAAQDWPSAAKQIDQIRMMVSINLVIGFVIVAVMTVGR